MIDIFKDDVTINKNPVLIQNLLTTKTPTFCTRPFWFVNGLEKKVKIGKRIFSAIDYLEAWCNINCFTYRSTEALERIFIEIKKAFHEVDNYIFKNK